MKTITVMCDRDSLSMSEDFYAPHERTFDCAPDDTLAHFITRVLQSDFLINTGHWYLKADEIIAVAFIHDARSVLVTKAGVTMERFSIEAGGSKLSFKYPLQSGPSLADLAEELDAQGAEWVRFG